ncbi:MAG: segregation and condensation protein A [Coriobacteriales bacterium]
MSYRVQIDAYQGPFDLLLQLVSKQKVDIGAISVTQIADQYLAEVERMQELDLDIASDFLVVAATLLQIKAASLVPAQDRAAVELDDDEFAELSPEETRDILVARLVNYKKFKNAAAALGARMEAQDRMHPRHAGIEEEFLNLVPDYLQGVTLHGLAVICADIAARRETFLLEAEHIAAVPISMERHVEGIYRTMRSRSARTFSQLVGDAPTPELLVVTFLAVLELYKRGVVSIEQDETFGEMELQMEPDAPEITDFSVPDWGMPEDPSLQALDGQLCAEEALQEDIGTVPAHGGAAEDGEEPA